ncbi:ComEA family DNA-binding protein [Larsenimonas suaedae]|uniref:ComEA family DNA-binding protein n=1 Tax=Larsenimonas suaedae TaxID=1851019 RepID=UPI00286CA56B|nr:ComEA family DNA-binding protein [Larsenimonas suaedae]
MKKLVAALITTAALSMAHTQAFASDTNTQIDINTATVEQLSELKGIGEKKAEAIVAYREANGPFEHLEGLSDVKGIGESLIEKNRDRMHISSN